MQYDAGIDVSLEQSSVCVVDAAGKIIKEAKIASDPCVLATFFKGLGFPVTRIGFEAGPLSHWLYAGLGQAGFDVVLLQTRHVKAALSAMVVKTDRERRRLPRCYFDGRRPTEATLILRYCHTTHRVPDGAV